MGSGLGRSASLGQMLKPEDLPILCFQILDIHEYGIIPATSSKPQDDMLQLFRNVSYHRTCKAHLRFYTSLSQLLLGPNSFYFFSSGPTLSLICSNINAYNMRDSSV